MPLVSNVSEVGTLSPRIRHRNTWRKLPIMELLISIVNEEQARLVAESGAGWVDLKDPRRGPLGAADQDQQRAVLRALSGWPEIRRSVALGEISELAAGEPWPQPLAGFQFAKLGTAGVGAAESPGRAASAEWSTRWLAWYHALPPGCCGVLVAYADASTCQGLSLETALDFAAAHGLPYLLVDTFDKSAGGLAAILGRTGRWSQVSNWIERAREQGTRIVWAGQLTRGDAQALADWQADVVGIRSAVCRPNPQGHVDRAGELCPVRLAEWLAWSRDVPPLIENRK